MGNSKEELREMVDMHNEYLQELNVAINTGNYMEACWLCYAIFEQRTYRIIEKIIPHCPVKKEHKKGFTGIKTRLLCLDSLRQGNYIGFFAFDKQIFSKIIDWCERRNDLIHNLVDLEKYKEYKYEFGKLAQEGKVLVKAYYKQASDFRKWFYEYKEQLQPFP